MTTEPKKDLSDLIDSLTSLVNLTTHIVGSLAPLLMVIAPIVEELLKEKGIDLNDYASFFNGDVSEEEEETEMDNSSNFN